MPDVQLRNLGLGSYSGVDGVIGTLPESWSELTQASQQRSCS